MTGRLQLLKGIQEAVRQQEGLAAFQLDAFQQDAFQTGYTLTAHGLQKATARRVAVDDIITAILDEDAEMVEDYPEDPRGPSCLILGWTQSGSPLHLTVAYPPDPAVITVYRPHPDKWVDYRTRREQ